MDHPSRRTFSLSPKKRALLDALLWEEGVKPSPGRRIPQREESGSIPLSFAQQRLWFLDRFEPGNPAYSIPVAVRFVGPLAVAPLEGCFREITRRHEILRTTFASVDGQQIQTVHHAVDTVLPVVDLRQLRGPEREAEIRRLVIEESQRLFDLARGPLFRTALLQLTGEEFILLLTMHHIVSDGWSVGVLIRELVTLYEAFSTGKPSPLPDLPIQYADFAVWQRQRLQGEILETQLSYWKQRIGGAPSVLNLPTDRPRPAIWTYRGAARSSLLPEALVESLKVLSRREEATLFMTLLAAFNVLLHRYTGQSDIVVGSPVANRTRPEIEGLIGFFVNTLALRTDLSGAPSFRELLRRVRETTLEAYAHQDLPFEKLVEELRPDRDMSHTPLFQVAFVLQDNPMMTLDLPGDVVVSLLDFHNKTAKFDLTVEIVEAGGGARISIEYSTDLFDAATISSMMDHFGVLLESIVADPDQRISDLSLLTEAERRQLLVEWNRTVTDYPRDQSIAELFEAQVERTPDAVAVVFENQCLTYGELNRRANQLAHHLQGLGVGPEVLVGICVERSAEMVVGTLGILKAGGAYVPLDPTYPKDRLDFMLADAWAPVLLTQGELLDSFVEHRGQVVRVDADWGAANQESEENPVSGTTGEYTAYVMYTSGSTGTPKGISIPHRAISRLVFNTNYIELEPLDRMAQASNVSFDAATFEIWGALLRGGALVILAKDVVLSPQDFVVQMREQGISTLFLTTALFNQLACEVPSVFSTVKHLLFGGQAVDPKRVREVLEKGAPERLLHVYGPTESTTYASWYLVDEVAEGAATVSIGRALSNTQLYVLDRSLQPVPVRVPGELYIGGDGLAHGYLSRPELTAERFVPDPLGDEPGSRLYKTGDMVRFLPDGNIEFVGRYDHQVKIRGFRVELGEIEAVLGQHPAVREVVVLAREVEGDKRLVGYIVPEQGQALALSELRDFLGEKLPDYMIPSNFLFLETLPLTPNKKVDRRALPTPTGVRPGSEEGFVAPRNPIEEALAGVWAKVLGVDRVSVHDNFFELGGHSLLAVRLMTRIREQFGQNLPLSTIFQGPTIERLARLLSRQGDSARSPLVAIQPQGSKRPFFCVHPGAGQVFPYVSLARWLDPDQPLYGLEDPGLDRDEDVYSRLEDMAAHYVQALRVAQPQGPYLLGGWSFGGVVAFEMAQLLKRQAHEVALLVLIDSGAPALVNKYFAAADDSKLLAVIANELSGNAGKRLLELYDDLQQLDPDEQLDYVLDQIKRGNHEILNIGAPLIRRQVQIFKARLQLVRDYVPQVYSGRIVLFLAEEMELERKLLLGVGAIWTQAQKLYRNATRLGWRRLSTRPIATHFIPGSHATIVDEPNVQVLAEKLQASLNEATGR